MQNKKNGSPKNLAKFLKELNREEKNVACLYYFENLAVCDIANILNKDEKFIRRSLEKFISKISLQLSKTQSASKRMSRQSK